MKKDKHIAMCGLDCNSCAAFIATQNKDNPLRERTAKEWTERYRKDGRNRPPIKAGDINCNGCLSNGSIYLYCQQCKIRQCGLEKKVTNCQDCTSYKCYKLIELQSHFLRVQNHKILACS